MKEVLSHLKGDKYIWALVFFLALYSFMPVFSASTNLVYTVGTGMTTTSYLFKHMVHLLMGLLIIFLVHKIPYNRFRVLSMLGLLIITFMLVITASQGKTIGGANASRWLLVPYINLSFQPSSFASVILIVYVAQYLAYVDNASVKFSHSLKFLWAPVFIVVGLILPSNFSTAALLLLMVCMVVFVGKYPFKYLMSIGVIGIGILLISFLTIKAFPSIMPTRLDTWVSRVERFTAKDKESVDLYQINNAKMAIATGGMWGLGPGKSQQKNFLPQSSSDFIFAIIVEEYGLFLGAALILGIYLSLAFRFLRASHKAPTLFGKLLVVGLGFYIIFQALINMGVAVELFPTTGQTLPLISSGGTSVWATCIALGIILSVTRKEDEIKREEELKEKKERAFQALLEKQMREQEKMDNPMNAVLNKK